MALGSTSTAFPPPKIRHGDTWGNREIRECHAMGFVYEISKMFSLQVDPQKMVAENEWKKKSWFLEKKNEQDIILMPSTVRTPLGVAGPTSIRWAVSTHPRIIPTWVLRTAVRRMTCSWSLSVVDCNGILYRKPSIVVFPNGFLMRMFPLTNTLSLAIHTSNIPIKVSWGGSHFFAFEVVCLIWFRIHPD